MECRWREGATRVNLSRPRAAAERGGKAKKASKEQRARPLVQIHGAISNRIPGRHVKEGSTGFYRKQSVKRKAARVGFSPRSIHGPLAKWLQATPSAECVNRLGSAASRWRARPDSSLPCDLASAKPISSPAISWAPRLFERAILVGANVGPIPARRASNVDRRRIRRITRSDRSRPRF
jgi:hypothetical protein